MSDFRPQNNFENQSGQRTDELPLAEEILPGTIGEFSPWPTNFYRRHRGNATNAISSARHPAHFNLLHVERFDWATLSTRLLMTGTLETRATHAVPFILTRLRRWDITPRRRVRTMSSQV